jgi:P27 family predicted phage terminase small subunit
LKKYEQLTDCGLLANIDAEALTRYAINWNRWLRLRKQVAKEGEVITEHRTEYSITKKNPAAELMHTVAMELHKLEAMFGMSPADRAGLAPMTSGEDDSDPFIRLATLGDKETA